MEQTIETEFDAALLPEWARRDSDVVQLCKHDLAFRCDVHRAETAQMHEHLRQVAREFCDRV